MEDKIVCSNCRTPKLSSEFDVKKNGQKRKLCKACGEWFTNHYETRKGKLCLWCGAPTEGTIYCGEHREIIRNQMRAKRANKAPRKCQTCGVIVGPFKQLCEPCRVTSRLEISRRWHKQRVETLYAKYGGARCVCCGETIFEFLSLDHIDNNGAAHRREIGGSGSHLYAWIVRKNYPPGFQVLCYNCNAGRYRNGGICPHQSAKLQAV